MRARIDQGARALDAAVTFVASVLLVIVTAIVFFAVVMREVGIGMAWTEEVTRYSYVWLVVLGAAIGMKSGAHFRMDFLPVPAQWRTRIDRALAIGVCGMFVAIALNTAPLIQTYIDGGQRTAVLQISMLFPFLSITVGSVLIALMAATRAVEDRPALAPDEDETDEAQQSWA